MNPELQRQLWLNFSLTRWLVMPALLTTVALAIGLNSDAPAHHVTLVFAVAFVFLVGVMGAYAVGNSVQDEVNDDTWDQQRMSAMQPWAMTWGKLAGASAYAWYGGAICLLIAIPSSMVDAQGLPLPTAAATAIGVLVGLFLQAGLLAINLQRLQLGHRVSRRSNALLLIPLLYLALNLTFELPVKLLNEGSFRWWGVAFPGLAFFLVSLGFFLVCALVAAWRAMGQVLAVRQLPWGWPLLSLVLTTYYAGHAYTGDLSEVGGVGLVICLAMTYLALFTESQSRTVWQRVVERVERGLWREALQSMPVWPLVWLLSVPFAGLLAAHLDSLDQHGALSFGFSPPLVMLVLRDACVALFFAFSRNTRRSGLAFFVTMALLYGLLPWLSAAAPPLVQDMVLPPLADKSGVWSFAFASLHAVAAMALLRWQWRKVPAGPTNP